MFLCYALPPILSFKLDHKDIPNHPFETNAIFKMKEEHRVEIL